MSSEDGQMVSFNMDLFEIPYDVLFDTSDFFIGQNKAFTELNVGP